MATKKTKSKIEGFLDTLEFGLTGKRQAKTVKEPSEDLGASSEVVESEEIDRGIAELELEEETTEEKTEEIPEEEPDHQLEFITHEKKIDVERTIETIKVNMSHSLQPRYEEVMRWIIKNNLQNRFIGSEVEVKGGTTVIYALKRENVVEVIDTEVVAGKKERNVYRINPHLIIWDGGGKEKILRPLRSTEETEIETTFQPPLRTTPKKWAGSVKMADELKKATKEIRNLETEKLLMEENIAKIRKELKDFKKYNPENAPQRIANLEVLVNERTLAYAMQIHDETRVETDDRLDNVLSKFEREWNSFKEITPTHPLLIASKKAVFGSLRRLNQEMKLNSALTTFKLEIDRFLQELVEFDPDTIKNMERWGEQASEERAVVDNPELEE